MNFYKKKWIGVILCGRRPNLYSVDKSVFHEEENKLVSHSYNLLNSVVQYIVLSVNEKQFPFYKNNYNDTEIIIDSNKLGGSLSGILSVFNAYRNFNFIVTSYKMRNITNDLLNDLIYNYNNQPGYDFYVYNKADIIEPFCGIYTAKGLENIHTLYNEGYLKTNSLIESIKLSNTLFLPIKNNFNECFKPFIETI